LHTTDAPAAVTRLNDIGVPGYLLAPTLNLIAAQRLIRKLCPECKEAYEVASEKNLPQDIKLNAELIYRAKGCDYCNHTGYRGRIAAYEVVAINENLRQAIARGVNYDEFKKKTREEGMKTLFENALKKVEAGITSLEEVLSVTLV
jgi:type IV pilus assembly protein PilB